MLGHIGGVAAAAILAIAVLAPAAAALSRSMGPLHDGYGTVRAIVWAYLAIAVGHAALPAIAAAIGGFA